MSPADRNDAIRTFLEQAGWGDATLTPLQGDASTRRYLRAASRGRIAMLMDQPPGAETPPCPLDASEAERHALGYNAVARLAGADCGRFVAVGNYLRAHGLSAPEIFAADTENGLILLEDLGDRLYADAIAAGANERELYAKATEALARLHTETAPAELAPEIALYAYDEVAKLAEIDLLPQWFLPLVQKRDADEAEILEHRALWRDMLRQVAPSSSVIVLRDYHSPNLLWLPERAGIAKVGIIDFQDAVAGTKSYDLVSLTEDARRDVAPELADATTRHYLDTLRSHGIALNEVEHRAEMAVIAAQRNAKIVGIFARLFKRDHKPRYLAHLPRMWRYLNRDLEHPILAPLKTWYDRKIPQELRTTPRTEGAHA